MPPAVRTVAVPESAPGIEIGPNHSTGNERWIAA